MSTSFVTRTLIAKKKNKAYFPENIDFELVTPIFFISDML